MNISIISQSQFIQHSLISKMGRITNLLAGVGAVFWLAVNSDGFLNRTDVVLPVDVDPSSGKVLFTR